MISNISDKRIVQVIFLLRLILTEVVKMIRNISDKRIVHDHRGNHIFADSLNLRHGTNNQEEAKSLFYGVEWCVIN